MSSRHSRRRVVRRTSIEPLEARQMFSAEPIGGLLGGSFEHHSVSKPDFWYDTNLDRELDAMLGDVQQTLAAANGLTGLTQARNDYGFLGYGQTVAVIDSGIAWDHPNLGAGFGSDYRVVGGWDFSEENDANPYDDGPSGAHGTHVAGIVGATANSSGDEGVVPGVDLVGLRVFNDQGAGYFGWVEKALRWVHTNRDAFDNPITSVNLSLGTAWNAATVPSWAMLEDEFAQLKADGIFVAVSAGNSFTSYNMPGLSYPAASASVVPVMSVDDNGSLSYFSQRHERAIAAPGRTIRSTVPDYVGNQNGRTDDWASFSGTSMAAPYVAGASVLVREAMEFVGYTSITQDTIYEHMLSTADEIFDTATNAFYKRLNVGAALDALMPEDDFGSTAATAFDLGAIGVGGIEVDGLIGKRSDVDYFRFTAASNGTVTFTATTSHYLVAQWTGNGVASDDGLSYTINVMAGESYTVGLSSSAGVGHFELAVTAASQFSFVDWGVVAQQQRLQGVTIQGESWYSVTAQQAGYLTAEAFYSNNCQVELTWFDANLQQVASGAAKPGCERVDGLAAAGERLFLRVSGASDSVDFRLTNLVALDGDALVVTGTEADDSLAFVAGDTHQVVVNGIVYEFASGAVREVRFDGAGGTDSIAVTGTSERETASLRDGLASVTGNGFAVQATNMENVVIFGGGGADEALLYDSAGDDKLTARPLEVTLELANGHAFEVMGYQQTRTYASLGTDTAELFDSAGDDVYAAWAARVYMTDGNYLNDARNFDQTMGRSTAGGADRAAFNDSSGDDLCASWSGRAYMTGAGYFNDTRGFSRTTAYATAGGNDRALFHDTHRDDCYASWSYRTVLYGKGYWNESRGFDRTDAYASGGNDRAVFYDTSGDDAFGAWADRAVLYGEGFWNDSRGFDQTTAYASLGNDKAAFYDTPGDDIYTAWSDRAVLSGTGYRNESQGFDRTTAYASGGNDQAIFYDSAGDDVYAAWSDRAVLYGVGFWNDARGFDRSTGNATAGGNDQAVLYDAPGSNLIVARAWGAYLSSDRYHNESRGFDKVSALLINGGTNSADVEAADYIFDLVGQWS